MNTMELIIIFLAVTVIVIALYTLKNGIGPTPSSWKVVRHLEAVLPEAFEGSITELGAGWGGVAVYLARKYPEKRVVAIENCPPVWLFCWLRAIFLRQSNLTVKFGDIYQEDLSEGLIYCYLYPGAMKKLLPQLQLLQPGSIVISHTFSLPGYTPEISSQARDIWRSTVYRYRLSQ